MRSARAIFHPRERDIVVMAAWIFARYFRPKVGVPLVKKDGRPASSARVAAWLMSAARFGGDEILAFSKINNRFHSTKVRFRSPAFHGC